jgi:hypothetical protein
MLPPLEKEHDMRNRWSLALLLFTGCLPTQLMPDDPPTQQVGGAPFADARKSAATKVNYAPAAPEVSFRVVMVKDKLIGENPQVGIKPYVTAIGTADPEVFHVGLSQIYITEGLVRQCATEGQLAAVLANELGRMISEREAAVPDDIRQPERLLPIALPIGSTGSGRDRDPINYIELAQHEKLYPKHAKKLPRPNPQLVARDILERAGYQRTELDAALPILQNAERFQVLENQFKGTLKQSEWKAQ